MCDAIVKNDMYAGASIILTHFSPSMVSPDIDTCRVAVPDLVKELYDETIRDDAGQDWKLILKGGSEISIEGEHVFDRTRETGLRSFVGESVHAAVSKDPERHLEIRRGEALTRRVNLKVCAGPYSWL